MRIKNRDFWVADFETSTEAWLEKDNGVARVWLWGIYDIQIDDFKWGTDLDSFMKYVLSQHTNHYNPIIYFHNLKYDGSYILNYLLSNGYEYTSEKPEEVGQFNACITDMGQWYFIDVCIYKKGNQKINVRFQDSLKKIPMPLRDIPVTFGFEDVYKHHLEYDEYRPIGYKPTEEELTYLLWDCKIPAMGLKELEKEGFTKMTLSSDSYHTWKKTLMTKKAQAEDRNPEFVYRELYPQLTIEQDDYVRRAYRGGWTYVNPKFANEMLNEVHVYDINSMYPSKLRNKYMPVGEPEYFKGKPHPSKYQCYITKIMIRFEIKPGHLPSIQVKHSYAFNPTEYITSSKGKLIELTVTNVDLKLIFKQYDVKEIYYVDGYYFRKVHGNFTVFIDDLMRIKEVSVGGKRFISKRRLNTVYGKSGSSQRKRKKEPYLDRGVLKFSMGKEEIVESEYTPLAVFTTAWARYDIISDAQKNYDHFVYCDTDSLHLLADNKEWVPDLPIHQSKIGFYKLESVATRAIFLRSKTYIEEINGELNVKCAGAPAYIQREMNFDNFKHGTEFEGKLMPKQVIGGCVLVKTCFTLK